MSLQSSPASRVEFGAPASLDVARTVQPLGLGRLVASGGSLGQTPASRSAGSSSDGPRAVVVASVIPALLEGLVSWLSDSSREWEVVGACASALDLVATLAGFSSPVVVVATEEVATSDILQVGSAHPDVVRLVVMAHDVTPGREAELIGRGASAVIALGSSRSETIRAVEELLAGRATVSVEALGLLGGVGRPDGPMLTARQREVLELLAMGQSTQQIAERLVVTPSTVKTHLRLIGERFGMAGQRAVIVNAHRLLTGAPSTTAAVG